MPSDDYSRLHVLIVEDFHNYREILKRNMHTIGFRYIDDVATGEEAIELCRKQHYDIILSDYNLGNGKNGQQLLEELRRTHLIHGNDIFMLISSDSCRDVVMSFYDCDPDVYLTKSIASKMLEPRIKRLLEKRYEMAAIYKCIEHQDINAAIELLKIHLQNNTRYAPDCQKLLGELYLQEKQYDQAEDLYRRVLQTRELDWAQVGLANIELERESANSACNTLEGIIEANPSCLKAYDSLSKACVKLGDTEKLQKVLERATEVSPMSIGRQQYLAETAFSNGDIDVAMQAYKNTIKYGEHSFYDCPENYLNFARTMAKACGDDISTNRKYTQEALTLLDEFNEKYEANNDQKLQSQLLGSQIYALEGKKVESQGLLSEAKELAANSGDSSIDTEIEMVKAMLANEDFVEVRKMLQGMVERYANDQDALEKLDELLDEPVSIKGKKEIDEINRKGIGAYKAESYEEAIEYFTLAQKKFPRDIGLKLNRIQSMIGFMKKHGSNPHYLEQCESTFKIIQQNISPGPQFDRCQQLQAMLQQALGPDQKSKQQNKK